MGFDKSIIRQMIIVISAVIVLGIFLIGKFTHKEAEAAIEPVDSGAVRVMRP